MLLEGIEELFVDMRQEIQFCLSEAQWILILNMLFYS
jgi:hypothetical protein